MIPTQFDYVAPTSVEDALSALAAHHQMTGFPIDVIERHSNYFARPQTQSRQQQQDRIVT